MPDGAAVESEVFALSLTPAAVAARTDSAISSATAQGPFIVGPENRLAGHAVQWLLNREGHSYNPLVLCGLSGTGKSHLARGVAECHENAVCTCGAEFVRELADAVENKTVEILRLKYRAAAMLVFEDLEQLAGHRAALVELQHTLDALEAREAPVVITSRMPPTEMARLPKSLRSRLSGGLVAIVSSPGVAARRTIMDRLATTRGISLFPAAAQLLAERLNVTAAELNGALLDLEMNCSTPADGQRAVIDVEHVHRYLSSRRTASVQPNLKQIAGLVAKYYGVKPATLSSASRRRQAVLARNVAIYLGRKLTGQSLQTLGKHFGDRDHTTVLHSLRIIEQRMPIDAELQTAVGTLQQLLSEK